MTKQEKQLIIKEIEQAKDVQIILSYLYSFDSKIKWTAKQRLINYFNLSMDNIYILL